MIRCTKQIFFLFYVHIFHTLHIYTKVGLNFAPISFHLMRISKEAPGRHSRLGEENGASLEMSPAQMFNLVRHWYENVLSGAVAVHGQGRTGGWNESESNLSRLFTPDYVNHVTPAPKDGWKRGIAGALQIMQIYRLSSPDLAIKVEEQMVCGDKVITRYIAEGTHTGRPFFNIPATSKRHKVTGIA